MKKLQDVAEGISENEEFRYGRAGNNQVPRSAGASMRPTALQRHLSTRKQEEKQRRESHSSKGEKEEAEEELLPSMYAQQRAAALGPRPMTGPARMQRRTYFGTSKQSAANAEDAEKRQADSTKGKGSIKNLIRVATARNK